MFQLLSLFALAFVCLPLAAQAEYPRQVPDEATFAATVEALEAGMDDGFASLRGERPDEDSRQPVLPAGHVNDDARDPAHRSHTLGAFAYSHFWVIKLAHQRTYKPSEEEVAPLKADYERLGVAMFAAAGTGSWRAKPRRATPACPAC